MLQFVNNMIRNTIEKIGTVPLIKQQLHITVRNSVLNSGSIAKSKEELHKDKTGASFWSSMILSLQDNDSLIQRQTTRRKVMV